MNDAPRSPRVAIIDNSIYPGVYDPVAHWTGHFPPGCAWESFTARDGVFPVLDGFTHVILTGSESSILEPDPWVAEEVDLVREAVGRGLAVLGSCWGHQLLAYALAGPGHVSRAPRPEIGWVPVRVLHGGELLGPAAAEAFMFSLHFDEVRDPGSAFEVLASTEACPIQAMRLKGKPVWGLQAHPEVDIPTGLKFLEDLLAMGFKGREELLGARASEPRDSALIRTIVASFLRSPRRP